MVSAYLSGNSVLPPWLVRPIHRPDAAMRLICVPHAGGGASSFHSLAALLPRDIEMLTVQLPGRESRLSEPPFRRMAPLIDALTDATVPLLGDKPYALFGHSMGALIAYELGRAFERERLPLPRTTIVSGRRAPSVPNTESPLHLLPDDQFVDALIARYDAIPKVIRDEPELMALFMPVLKADFEVFETHRHVDAPPLEGALAIYGGRADPQTRQMEGWTELYSGACRTRLFDGGHFYLADQRRALADALAEDVLGAVAVF
jgi:medium-chain acyl-[acyl-carrier-protein] hydrolase